MNVDPVSTQTTYRAGSPQRLHQVGDQVVDVLDADGEPDEVGGHLERRSPATDACVMRPGCSMSDSTPPSDSPRVNSRARSHTSSAAASPPATRKLTMPPKSRICLTATWWPSWPSSPG